MAIRLAALDVDGTLLTSENIISSESKRAICEAAEQGIEIVINTGRSYSETRYLSDQLPQVRYMICATGAYILDLQTMKILGQRSMPAELGRRAYDALRGFDCMVHYFTELDVRNDRSCLENFARYMPEYARPLIKNTHTMVDSLDAYVAQWQGPVEKLYVSFPDTDVQARAIAAVRDLPVYVTDGGLLDMEIVSREANKGAALEDLAKLLGIAREEVLAMGDSGNDCAMLAYAGVGAAMGNASEKAKRAADLVAPGNDEEGVAWMLRRAARGEI